MIEITLNGEKTVIDEGTRLSDFLQMNNYELNSFAVAINEIFVPRSQYEKIIINLSDRIEILSPMQGG